MNYRRMFLLTSLVFVGCAREVDRPKAEAPTSDPPKTAPQGAAVPSTRIERLTVTKTLNPDQSPGVSATTFGPNDTVYVSMWTSNVAADTEILARWYAPDGTMITEDRIVADTTAEGYRSFHAAQTKGWQTGEYKVEVLIGGEKVAETTFTVAAEAPVSS